VQIIVDQLNKLRGWKVNSLETPELRWFGKRKKMEVLLGSELVSIDRRAKYIIFTFSKGTDNFYIINHLSISGNWLIRDPRAKSSIHTRLTFSFSQDSFTQATKAIDFVDARHFGRLEFYNSTDFWSEKIQSKLSNLGPDTLNEIITSEILNQRIHNFVENDPRWEIKSLLMEQAFLAGIGNIYASEICFLAGINPYRKASTLTQDEIKQLEEAIPVVIKTAYKNNGSTIRSSKTTKTNWIEHMIYGIKYCRLCNSPVSRGPQSNRTTYWCPKCQVL